MCSVSFQVGVCWLVLGKETIPGLNLHSFYRSPSLDLYLGVRRASGRTCFPGGGESLRTGAKPALALFWCRPGCEAFHRVGATRELLAKFLLNACLILID